MSRRIRVLVVSSSMGEGGAQRVTSTVLARLDRDLFESKVCLFREELSFPIPSDVEIASFTTGDSPRIANKAKKNPLIIVQLINWLRRQIDTTRPDVVLSNIDQANLITGAALRLCRHRPRWIARLGTAPNNQRRSQHLLARMLYRRADAIVVNSSGLGKTIARMFPALADRVALLRNPIDLARLEELADHPTGKARPAATPVVLTVGRFVPEKRTDLFVEAIAKVRARMPVRAWICASGPLRRDVENLISARNLGDAVELLGFCDNPYALMKQADLFVLTSDFEGLPNALIEAQALGLAAVATNCEFGPAEIVEHGETGLLTPPGDADRLADAIAELLGDKGKRERMAIAARQRAREIFAADELIAQWQRLLMDGSG